MHALQNGGQARWMRTPRCPGHRLLIDVSHSLSHSDARRSVMQIPLFVRMQTKLLNLNDESMQIGIPSRQFKDVQLRFKAWRRKIAPPAGT
jgi:hypothetical protein